MIRADYHVHTVFSDGKNTPEETVLAAIAKGMTAIGFSDHSYISLPYEIPYWMKKEDEPLYKAEIARLREKYRDRIRILCGIEQDYDSDHPAEGYDYIIGAVHFVKVGGALIGVDESAEYTREHLPLFGGDYYALAEAYYARLAEVVKKTKCDYIAHFDLVSKFNENGAFFDPRHPRYVKAWRAAADALLAAGKPFEINTGAVANGYRTAPYPDPEIREYLAARGAKFILSSDAHKKENLCFGFEKQSLF